MRQRQWVGHVCYHCCGRVSDKKQLKGERVYFDSQSKRIGPIKAGNPWHQEGKATGYIVSAGRKQKTDRKWGLTIKPQGPTLMAHSPLLVPLAGDQVSNTQMYGRHFTFSQQHRMAQLCVNRARGWGRPGSVFNSGALLCL